MKGLPTWAIFCRELATLWTYMLPGWRQFQMTHTHTHTHTYTYTHTHTHLSLQATSWSAESPTTKQHTQVTQSDYETLPWQPPPSLPPDERSVWWSGQTAHNRRRLTLWRGSPPSESVYPVWSRPGDQQSSQLSAKFKYSHTSVESNNVCTVIWYLWPAAVLRCGICQTFTVLNEL